MQCFVSRARVSSNLQNQNQNDDDNNSSNSSSIEQQNKMTNSETDDVISQQPQERMSEVEVVVQPPTPESNSKKSPVDQKPVVQFTGGSVENVAVVVWEATVTGRRLIDEMINLGAYYAEDDASDEQVADSESNSKEPADDASSQQFNEYVMPYGKLPLNVIRNYNLRIVDTGRYRMLKEIRHNRMLKSKSEVAAVNDLATWLIQLQRTKFPNKKIVLVYFEPRHTKILQLFQVCNSKCFLLSDILSPRLLNLFVFLNSKGFRTLPTVGRHQRHSVGLCQRMGLAPSTGNLKLFLFIYILINASF